MMKKEREFIFKDNKEKSKNNIFNEYGYNFDDFKRRDIYDHSKLYHYENFEYKKNKVK